MRKDIYIEMGHHPQVILDTMDQIRPILGRLELEQKLMRVGRVALYGLAIVAFLLAFFLSGGEMVSWILFVLAFLAVAAGIAMSKALKPNRFVREHFESAYRILHTLRDDTGRKGRVIGWLDLSGPRQKEKRVRTASSSGGKRKEYYRDPWFQTKIKLADDNVLRLALVDKVKTKAGSVVNHRTQVKAKLVINPNLYHAGHVPDDEIPLPRAFISEENGLISFAAEVSPRNLQVGPLLETLKAFYSHLEPIGQDPVPGASEMTSVPETPQK